MLLGNLGDGHWPNCGATFDNGPGPVDGRGGVLRKVIDYLQCVVNRSLAPVRRPAVGEAVQWPGMWMANVATELKLSKSLFAKLAALDIREDVATELRARLAYGFNPPRPR